MLDSFRQRSIGASPLCQHPELATTSPSSLHRARRAAFHAVSTSLRLSSPKGGTQEFQTVANLSTASAFINGLQTLMSLSAACELPIQILMCFGGKFHLQPKPCVDKKLTADVFAVSYSPPHTEASGIYHFIFLLHNRTASSRHQHTFSYNAILSRCPYSKAHLSLSKMTPRFDSAPALEPPRADTL